MQIKIGMDRMTKEGAFVGLIPGSKVTITMEKGKTVEATANKDGIAKIDFSVMVLKYLREELDVAITHKGYTTTNLKMIVRQTKIILISPKMTQTKKG